MICEMFLQSTLRFSVNVLATDFSLFSESKIVKLSADF